MLNAASPLPLYQQLADRLVVAIEGGQYGVGQRIPSEHALAARYGIGRPTVRQATELLVRRGLLERRRGAGTFVSGRPQPIDAFSASGTLASFRDRGVVVSAHLVDPPRLLDVPGDVGDNPFAGRSAYLVVRLALTTEGPALLEETYLDPEVFVGVEALELASRSLADQIRELYGTGPTGGRQELSVALLDDGRAGLLGLEPGAPTLLARRYLDFASGTNAIYAELYHRTDRVVLAQTMEGG